MILPKNLLSGTHEPPEFYLCQVDKTIIGGLNVIEPTGVFKFNAYSEITFQVDRLYQHPITGEMVVNPIYDYVEALRLVYVVDFGYFQIQEANIVSDGIREYKDCVCYSLEYELTQKYLDLFTINRGTVESIDGVKLCDGDDMAHSLIHLVLDKMNYGFYDLPPEERQKLIGKQWIVGHVDPSLQNLRRSFEVDHEAIYDFLMNDMAEAFQMVVVFDTYDRTVNLYEESSAGSETNIRIAMDTIANEVKVDYSADDIKTCLYVYGADDLSIREINLGFEYITNIDYYNKPEWLGEDLYIAYKEYRKLVEEKRTEYSEIMKQWSKIYDDILELENKVPDYDESYDDDIPTIYSKSDLPAPSENNVYMTYRVVEVDATWYYICKSELVDGATTYRWVLDVDNISSFYTFPTPSIEYVGGVYRVYNSDNDNGDLYYKCVVVEGPSESNNWTTKYGWRVAESDYGINLLKEKEEVYLTIQEVQVSAGFASADINSPEYKRYEENLSKLNYIRDELLAPKIKELNALNADLKQASDDLQVISDAISFDNCFTPEQIIMLNSFVREDEYTNDNILITEYDSYDDIISAKQDLLNSAQKELEKISQPQLSFSMDMANILAIPEFEPVINDFECGNYVTVEIRPDYIIKTQIIEVNINFDDMSDFSVVFGNQAFLHSQIDIHTALMSQAISAGKSVASNGSYWDSGANKANSILNRIESGLIDANTSIKGTENQAIEWDSHGIHLRKYANESKSSFFDEQIWLNNEKIVFTDDGWNTAKMAIGKFTDINLGETYGIIAPSIVGTLLAGQNLVIESETKDGELLSSFRVDETGARLYNSTFLMEKPVTGTDGTVSNGQIMIDPAYGIVAGSDIYITKADGTIVPAFANEDGTIQKDGIFPLNSNFFLDITDGNAYFRGYVYAEDGYFTGTITSATVESATGNFSGNITAESGDIGGWIVRKGILYSTGIGSSEQNFVGLSSKYDYDGNTSNYAMWAGAMSPSDAPFSVQRNGTVTMRSGNISCGINVGDGNFVVDENGNVSITSGTINIGSGNFSVDANGNVTLSGDINMSGASSITWGGNSPIVYQYSSDNSSWHDERQSGDIYRRESFDGGATWEEGYQFVAQDGEDGSDASVTYNNIKSALNRASKSPFTFVTGSSIDTPQIYAAEIYGGRIYAGEGEDAYAMMTSESFELRLSDDDENDNPRAALTATTSEVELVLGVGTSTTSGNPHGRMFVTKYSGGANVWYVTSNNKETGFDFTNDNEIITYGALCLDSNNYGSKLPSSGTEGQIFFLI